MKHEAPVTGSKFCPGCRQDLQVMAFAAAPEHADGMHLLCRECEGRLARTRRAARYRPHHDYNDLLNLD